MAYYPNSDAGLEFDNNCTENCFHQNEDELCPIAFAQINFNYVQHGNHELKEVLKYLVDDKYGCMMYKLFKKYKIKIEIPEKNQLLLFDKQSEE